FLEAESGEPVPGKDTCNSDDQSLTIGCKSLEKHFRTGLHMAMQQDLAVLVEDTHVHAASMQINVAIRLVLLGVESPEVSSSFVSESFPLSAYHRGMLRRGPQ